MPRSAPLTDARTPAPAAARGPAGRPARHIPYRVAAVVLALFAAIPMMGLIDLGTLIGTSDPRYLWPVSLDVSWGGLFTFLLAGSYAWLAVRPRDAAPALAQLAVSALALGVGAAAGASLETLWVALGVAASIALFAPLLRRASVSRPTWRRPDWRYGVLATAGLLLWIPYALAALEVSRSVHEPYVTNGVDHWPVQGAVGIALATLPVALASWPTVRPLIRGSVALSAALIGVAALAYPDRGGATQPELWAIAVVVWAVLVALVPTSASGSRD